MSGKQQDFNTELLNPLPAIHDHSRFNPLKYWPIKSLLLGMKCVFKH